MTRFFDILFSCLGLICLSPILLVIYILIKTESKGPGLYAQKRIGKDGKPFKLLKFRTMREGSDKGNQITIGEDERITKIGRHLRKYKLDELPQLVNVIKGEMSLVGTRPPTLDEWEKYDLHHRVRMSIKPGITGLWQISGRSDITDFEEVVRLDREYIETWSVELDFQILLKTVSVVLKHEGAE